MTTARRSFRFSLRTLFVVVTVCASLAALFRLDVLALLQLLLVLLVAIPVIIAVGGTVLVVVCYCVAAMRLNSQHPTEDMPAADADHS